MDRKREGAADVLVLEIQPLTQQIVDLLKAHEHDWHEGQVCLEERSNAIGYMIHRLGMYYQGGILRALQAAKDYEDRHHREVTR